MTDLLTQITNITKAHAYDTIQPMIKELQTENEMLRDRVKYLENLIKEYTDKMLNTLK